MTTRQFIVTATTSDIDDDLLEPAQIRRILEMWFEGTAIHINSVEEHIPPIDRTNEQEWAYSLTHERLLRTFKDSTKHPKDYTKGEIAAIQAELVKRMR